ncbi:MAG: efflux RND transporter periplasmic adaptor subunit [Thermotogae bacterium]|nr:efflux RND transporter periplasmic adaptor subunit [Thermotogota bacterium]
MKKWIVIIVIIAIVVVGVGVWYFGFRKPAASAASSANPDLAVVNGAHVLYTVSATSIGNYLPLVGAVTGNTYNIGPYISGQITNVYVWQGQLVGMNQPLAKLNSTQYQLNYIQALNNYYNALLSQDASSVIQQYKLALQLAKENLNYTTITSPATGFIEHLNVATGDFVNAQTSSSNLITIIQNTGMWVTADVNEVDLADIKVGQTALITFTQLNNLTLKGKVSFVQPFATTQSGLTVIPINITFDQDPLKYGVIYGLDCNINLLLGTSKGVLIPYQAVFTGSNGQKYVLLQTSSGYQRSPVTLGSQSGMMVQVTSGVKDGDVLIMKVPSEFQQTGNAFRGVFRGRR